MTEDEQRASEQLLDSVLSTAIQRALDRGQRMNPDSSYLMERAIVSVLGDIKGPTDDK
jgi:hypothetical protein